jgi:hypothetical protein
VLGLVLGLGLVLVPVMEAIPFLEDKYIVYLKSWLCVLWQLGAVAQRCPRCHSFPRR